MRLVNSLRQSVWILLVLLLLPLGGCRKQPIQVGFAGELTGKQSNLGLHGRNGVQLAIETINEEGGINGRSIKLLVEDDLGTPAGARAAAENLIAANPVAIIGHMTSVQTVNAYPVTEAAEMILFSPAATTPELSARDDYFFRVAATHLLQSEAFARCLYRERGIRRLAGIYDLDNDAYTQSYWEFVAKTFTEMGGEVSGAAAYSSGEEPIFAPLLTDLQSANPDGLFIIASPLDTALIAQEARQMGWTLPLFAAAWAQTNTMIQNGGTAVEGIEIVIGFDVNSQNPAYRAFARRYEDRFGFPPTFAAGEAYEAMMILAAALAETGGEVEGLRTALQNVENFPGLIGPISFDTYGDVLRPLFLIRVQDGLFVTAASLPQESVK